MFETSKYVDWCSASAYKIKTLNGAIADICTKKFAGILKIFSKPERFFQQNKKGIVSTTTPFQ